MVAPGSVYRGGCYMGVAQMNWPRTGCTVEVQYMRSSVHEKFGGASRTPIDCYGCELLLMTII